MLKIVKNLPEWLQALLFVSFIVGACALADSICY